MNKNDILVSIIVAIYKSEPFIGKLLDSILNQTYKKIEIILVDDGSPDNSGMICDEYASKDSRIKVIHKQNGGACEARNVGLEHANGEYVSIIDGDDWLEPDYIEYLLGLALNAGADMSMTDQIFTTRDHKQNDDESTEIWSAEKAASSILYPIIPIGPWNKLYRLQLLKDNNISFSVPWSGEGLYFSFMAAQHSNKVAVGHRKVYVYRLNNAGSGLTNYNVQMGINALWNIKNIKSLNFKKSKTIEDAANWHIWKNYHFLLKLIVATNGKDKYKKEYDECLKGMKIILPTVLLHSNFGVKTKIRMFIMTMAPVRYAKRIIYREQEALKKDLLNL